MCWIQKTLVFEVGLAYDLADLGHAREGECQETGRPTEGKVEEGEAMEEAVAGHGCGLGFLVIQGREHAAEPSRCKKLHLVSSHPLALDQFVCLHLEYREALCLARSYPRLGPKRTGYQPHQRYLGRIEVHRQAIFVA